MKVAIAGYGLEGEASYRYFSADPTNVLTIVDQKQPTREIPHGVSKIVGEDAFANLDGFDMVIRTAGLAPRKIKTNGKIWSATNEFFSKCPAPIIGVTGSKGKGTTASLIASILRAAGKKVWLVGNIGVAGLDILSDIAEEDSVVYELSSFQLWDIERSPHVAVVLFIEQEHLDVHADMNDYIAAKSRIAMFQSPSDSMIFNQSNQYATSIADSSAGVKYGYQSQATAHVRDGSFYYGEHIICSTDALQLVGGHNLDNACAAIDAVWSQVSDSTIIEKGLRAFRGLPHRLQFVREVNGVSYYDDSIATTPGSAIAALRAFDSSKVIILGGSSKGSDFSSLADELTLHDVQAILIGDEASKIALACQEAGFTQYHVFDTPSMQDVVLEAQKLSKQGGVVLLSPASASFGLFKNYVDRGEQFTTAVESL